MAASAALLIPPLVADAYELAGRFRERGEAIARTVGQTQARWQVMSAASGSPLTVPQIARRLGVSRQNVQRIADALVGEDCAGFAPNPDHAGSPFLLLTRRGETALAAIGRAAQAYHADLAARLGPVELAAIQGGLRRLLAAIADPKET